MPTAFAIAAHPDDIEFLMSGTLMLLGQAGFSLHCMNVGNGCCGSNEDSREETIRKRRSEAMAAAAYIGAIWHESLCDDLAIFYDQPTLARVASVVREVAPDILLTHSPVDYMEDHTNVCRLAVTAAFSRGMPNFSVDPPRPSIAGNVSVYHAQPYSHHDPLRRLVEPEMYVDVTGLMEKKAVMLGLHASQKGWLDASQGLDSWLQTMRDLDAQCGRMSGKFRFAEGWRRHLHLGLCSETDDPLSVALNAHLSASGPPGGRAGRQ